MWFTNEGNQTATSRQGYPCQRLVDLDGILKNWLAEEAIGLRARQEGSREQDQEDWTWKTLIIVLVWHSNRVIKRSQYTEKLTRLDTDRQRQN